MFPNLSVASKTICFVIIILCVIALLTCIGLLIESVKQRKEKIKNNVEVKKYDLSIIIPSTIIGTAVVGVVLSIVGPFVANQNIDKQRASNSFSFEIEKNITFDNVFDGLDKELLLSKKPGNDVTIRNYEIAFVLDSETNTYVVDSKNNNKILVNYTKNGIDYLYRGSIEGNKIKFSILDSKDKHDFSLDVRYTSGNDEPSVEDVNKTIKKFDKSLFFDKYIGLTSGTKVNNFVISAKVKYGFKGFDGFFIDEANNINKFYQVAEPIAGYRHSYGVEFKVGADSKEVSAYNPDLTATYIL